MSGIGSHVVNSAECQTCGKKLDMSEATRNYVPKFCSHTCFGASRKVGRIEKPCPVCGKLKLYRPIEEAKACKGDCVSELCRIAWKEGKFANQTGPSEKAKKRMSIKQKKRLKLLAKSGELETIRIKAKIARGLEDHVSAKQWVILDPSNKRYTMSNLQDWCRKNVHLFHDKRPKSKMPFAERISHGLMKTLGDNGSVSYQEWRAISKSNQ